MSRSPAQRGFTLLELLVAVAVFAVFAVMAYGGLNSVLKAREETNHASQRLTEMQLTLMHLGRDLEQVVARPIRDEYGAHRIMFIAADLGKLRLEFTRDGYPNPASLPRSSLQRIAYVLDEDTLYRYSWNVLDRAQDSRAQKQVLLKGVEELGLRVLQGQDQWFTIWPGPNDQSPEPGLPRAVEVTLSLKDWGSIKRLYLLPEMH